MTWFFTPHARQRFQERHGFKPSVQILSNISMACRTGRAVKVRQKTEGGDVYCVEVQGIRVFPVIADDIIITFMPPNFMSSSEARAHRKEQAKATGKTGRYGRLDYPQPYKRDRRNPLAEEA